MRAKHTSGEDRALRVEYTTRAVTGWGGLVSLVRFFDTFRVRDWLDRALPDGRTSNNQVPVTDLILQFLMSVITGGSRFEHIERIKEDTVLQRMLRAKRFGSASVLTRYLGNFAPGQNEHLLQTLWAPVFQRIEDSEDVLDLDSTVFSRSGEQEGSDFGYNPQKRRLRSHHPLLAMFAKSKLIAHCWLRTGSAAPQRGCGEMLIELLARLPATFRIIAVRADSGFYSDAFLSLLEERGLDYAIAVRRWTSFERWCGTLDGWTRINKHIELTEGFHSPRRSGTQRRMIVIRKTIRREHRGVLFEVIDHEYRAIVTSMKGSPEEVWRFYNGRGDCENRIKELKSDFNAAKFCLQSFEGTQATFRLICFTFNLLSLFKTVALKDPLVTLGTLRHRVFVIGANLGSSGRVSILRLGLPDRWKGEFQAMLDRIDAWTGSTAAQLQRALANAALEPPSIWRTRRVRASSATFY